MRLPLALKDSSRGGRVSSAFEASFDRERLPEHLPWYTDEVMNTLAREEWENAFDRVLWALSDEELRRRINKRILVRKKVYGKTKTFRITLIVYKSHAYLRYHPRVRYVPLIPSKFYENLEFYWEYDPHSDFV